MMPNSNVTLASSEGSNFEGCMTHTFSQRQVHDGTNQLAKDHIKHHHIYSTAAASGVPAPTPDQVFHHYHHHTVPSCQETKGLLLACSVCCSPLNRSHKSGEDAHNPSQHPKVFYINPCPNGCNAFNENSNSEATAFRQTSTHRNGPSNWNEDDASNYARSHQRGGSGIHYNRDDSVFEFQVPRGASMVFPNDIEDNKDRNMFTKQGAQEDSVILRVNIDGARLRKGGHKNSDRAKIKDASRRSHEYSYSYDYYSKDGSEEETDPTEHEYYSQSYTISNASEESIICHIPDDVPHHNLASPRSQKPHRASKKNKVNYNVLIHNEVGADRGRSAPVSERTRPMVATNPAVPRLNLVNASHERKTQPNGSMKVVTRKADCDEFAVCKTRDVDYDMRTTNRPNEDMQHLCPDVSKRPMQLQSWHSHQTSEMDSHLSPPNNYQSYELERETPRFNCLGGDTPSTRSFQGSASTLDLVLPEGNTMLHSNATVHTSVRVPELGSSSVLDGTNYEVLTHQVFDQFSIIAPSTLPSFDVVNSVESEIGLQNASNDAATQSSVVTGSVRPLSTASSMDYDYAQKVADQVESCLGSPMSSMTPGSSILMNDLESLQSVRGLFPNRQACEFATLEVGNDCQSQLSCSTTSTSSVSSTQESTVGTTQSDLESAKRTRLSAMSRRLHSDDHDDTLVNEQLKTIQDLTSLSEVHDLSSNQVSCSLSTMQIDGSTRHDDHFRRRVSPAPAMYSLEQIEADEPQNTSCSSGITASSEHTTMRGPSRSMGEDEMTNSSSMTKISSLSVVVEETENLTTTDNEENEGDMSAMGTDFLSTNGAVNQSDISSSVMPSSSSVLTPSTGNAEIALYLHQGIPLSELPSSSELSSSSHGLEENDRDENMSHVTNDTAGTNLNVYSDVEYGAHKDDFANVPILRPHHDTMSNATRKFEDSLLHHEPSSRLSSVSNDDIASDDELMIDLDCDYNFDIPTQGYFENGLSSWCDVSPVSTLASFESSTIDQDDDVEWKNYSPRNSPRGQVAPRLLPKNFHVITEEPCHPISRRTYRTVSEDDMHRVLMVEQFMKASKKWHSRINVASHDNVVMLTITASHGDNWEVAFAAQKLYLVASVISGAALHSRLPVHSEIISAFNSTNHPETVTAWLNQLCPLLRSKEQPQVECFWWSDGVAQSPNSPFLYGGVVIANKENGRLLIVPGTGPSLTHGVQALGKAFDILINPPSEFLRNDTSFEFGSNTIFDVFTMDEDREITFDEAVALLNSWAHSDCVTIKNSRYMINNSDCAEESDRLSFGDNLSRVTSTAQMSLFALKIVAVAAPSVSISVRGYRKVERDDVKSLVVFCENSSEIIVEHDDQRIRMLELRNVYEVQRWLLHKLHDITKRHQMSSY